MCEFSTLVSSNSSICFENNKSPWSLWAHAQVERFKYLIDVA